LSNISANKSVFLEECHIYQDALTDSGYNQKLEFKPQPTNITNKKRNRSRNITWFNPPYSTNVTSNIGQTFLKLIETSFPPTSPLHKIINKNTVKISYRCSPNMSQIISRHNSQIIKKYRQQEMPNVDTKTCSCPRNKICPLNGECLASEIVYQATVSRPDKNEKENYIGLCATTFKARLANHTASFKHKEKSDASCLSKYIWELKEKGIDYSINWKLIKKCKSFSPVSGRCILCLTEKLYIIFHPEMASLNSRNELVSHCRHKKKCMIGNM
jgi:hypothetical protein